MSEGVRCPGRFPLGFSAAVTPTAHLGRGEKGRRVPGRVRNSVAIVAEPGGSIVLQHLNQGIR